MSKKKNKNVVNQESINKTAVEAVTVESTDCIEDDSKEQAEIVQNEEKDANNTISVVEKKPYYHYELTFLHEDKKGELHRFHIEMKHFRVLFGTILGIFILVCCILGYRQYRASNQLDEALTVVNNLKEVIAESDDQIATLNQQIAELTESNTIMGDSLTAKTETLNTLMAEEEALYIPHAYPLKGTAAITEADETVSEDAISENETSTEMAVYFLAGSGTKVNATADGTVTEVTVDEQNRVCIVIDHGNGYKTYYHGNGNVLVDVNTKVVSGTILMQITEDNTEFVYQITYQEEYIDPMNCIEING